MFEINNLHSSIVFIEKLTYLFKTSINNITLFSAYSAILDTDSTALDYSDVKSSLIQYIPTEVGVTPTNGADSSFAISIHFT